MTAQEQAVLSELVNRKIITSSTIFQVEEYHLEKYIAIYHEFFGKTSRGTGSNNNYRFARRLAGRTLLAENFNRGAKFNDLKAGLLYLIQNPAFPDHYKAGMTINLKQRLSQYQTYDPFRQFKIAKYDFVLDRRYCESRLLNHPLICKEEGEWVNKLNALDIFKSITIPR